MLTFFRDWFQKLFAREAWVAIVLLVVATVAMFAGQATFVEWAAACGGFVSILQAGLYLKKREERLNK